jgi:hypothetical protein
MQMQMQMLLQQNQQLRMGGMGMPALQQSVQELPAQPALTPMMCAVPGMPGMQTLVMVPSSQVGSPELQGRCVPQQYAAVPQMQHPSLQAMYANAQSQPQVLVPTVDALETDQQPRMYLPASPAYTPQPTPMVTGGYTGPTHPYTVPTYMSLQQGGAAIVTQTAAAQQPGYGGMQARAAPAGSRVFGAVSPIQVSPRGIYAGSQLSPAPQAEHRAYMRGYGGNEGNGAGGGGYDGGSAREGQRSGSFSATARPRRSTVMEESSSPSASGSGSAAGMDASYGAALQTAAPGGSGGGGIAASDGERRAGCGRTGRRKRGGSGGQAKTAPPLPG